jgi:hypothetical protein
MAKNEDVNEANQGAPAADIPDLKKKEKERKKAGAGWGSARPGGGSFSGATGGSGSAGGAIARAAASAASSTGGAAAGAAAQAVGAGWLSSMLATLTATLMGKAILAAGVAMFLAGAGLFGYAMFYGAAAGGAGGIGDLGAISSSMKIRTDGGDRTGYIASNGEIMFDPLKAAEAKKAEAEKAPEEQTAGEPVPPAQTADAVGKGSDWNRPGLEHNLSGAKLSSSLGGGFGGKNIFAGSSAAPKFDAGLAKANIKGGEKGRLSASRNARTGRRVAGGRGQQVKANRAFGQLKVAKGMSALGAGTSGAEGARSSAAAAFDGSPTGGGNVVGGPEAQTGPVDTPSSPGGAPDVTAPNVDIPAGVAVDPNTAAMIAAIAAMAKKAGEMKKKAAQLMMMGIALIAAGAAMMGSPFTAPIGAMLIGIGGMLIGMSIMMSQMAAMMKDMADSMSQGLAARTSDVKQDEINKYCIDKAYNEGTDPKNCNPPDSVTENSTVIENNNQAVSEHKKKEKEDAKTETINELKQSPTGP